MLNAYLEYFEILLKFYLRATIPLQGSGDMEQRVTRNVSHDVITHQCPVCKEILHISGLVHDIFHLCEVMFSLGDLKAKNLSQKFLSMKLFALFPNHTRNPCVGVSNNVPVHP
jgi:hypothetical protein